MRRLFRPALDAVTLMTALSLSLSLFPIAPRGIWLSSKTIMPLIMCEEFPQVPCWMFTGTRAGKNNKNTRCGKRTDHSQSICDLWCSLTAKVAHILNFNALGRVMSNLSLSHPQKKKTTWNILWIFYDQDIKLVMMWVCFLFFLQKTQRNHLKEWIFEE